MGDKVCWIELSEDGPEVAAAYDELRRDDGSVHNLYRAFSQFPAPMVSADRFYRDVMHDPAAPLPMWLAELLSVDVAIVNGCDYALTHHGANFIALYDDETQAQAIVAALKQDHLDAPVLDDKVRALLTFGRKLTRQPDAMAETDIEALRAQGYSDAEISQAVQVTASFGYWTRVINGLGISTGDEKIGKYD